jgi:vacuolar-type H+-ATPase catalytic subunit A/Vma1
MNGIPVPNGPEGTSSRRTARHFGEICKLIADETERWADVVRSLDMKPE